MSAMHPSNIQFNICIQRLNIKITSKRITRTPILCNNIITTKSRSQHSIHNHFLRRTICRTIPTTRLNRLLLNNIMLRLKIIRLRICICAPMFTIRRNCLTLTFLSFCIRNLTIAFQTCSPTLLNTLWRLTIIPHTMPTKTCFLHLGNFLRHLHDVIDPVLRLPRRLRLFQLPRHLLRTQRHLPRRVPALRTVDALQVKGSRRNK